MIKEVKCCVCNKKTNKDSSKIKRNKKNYCSRICYWESLKGKKPVSECWKNKPSWVGEGNPNFNGYKSNNGNYIIINIPDHPNADKHGYVAEHRLVMEKQLGRYLDKKEVVHHIDGNKNNNNLSNLMLFPSNSAHINYHYYNKLKFQKK